MSKLKFIIIFAFILLSTGIFLLFSGEEAIPENEPYREPPTKSYKNAIAGVGIVEAYRENIHIKPHRQGLITEIYVKENDQVKKGAPLFKIDDDELQARYQAFIQQAEAQKVLLKKLQNEPRKEDIPIAKAKIQQTKAQLEQAKAQYEKLCCIENPKAISKDQLDTAKYQFEAAEAAHMIAKAEYDKLMAGAWSFDVEKAREDYQALLAQAKETSIMIRQSVVKAPKEGEILKVYSKPGEYVAFTDQNPPVLFGTTETMQVRVDIDEVNAPKVNKGAKAMAYLKGNSDIKFPLNFVRIQPYMVPKTNLTGNAQERVDVRVLQVIYSFDKTDKFPVYVGQQVYVYLENEKMQGGKNEKV